MPKKKYPYDRQARRASYLRCREQQTAYTREKQRAIRDRLLRHLGGKCIRCGFTDSRALQFDHINGDGGYEIRDVFKTNQAMYLFYATHLDQATLRIQLLCANCNWIKRFEQREHGGMKGAHVRRAELALPGNVKMTQFTS